MDVSTVKGERLVNENVNVNVSNEDTNTYDTTYVFDIHTNNFNPNKLSTNAFLYKLNRRMNEMNGYPDIELFIISNDRTRLYNTK